MRRLLVILIILLSVRSTVSAQATISGTVRDAKARHSVHEPKWLFIRIGNGWDIRTKGTD